MNRRYIISLYALTALGFALLPSTAISKQKIAQGPARRDLDACVSKSSQ
jgi:hypothetical protein